MKKSLPFATVSAVLIFSAPWIHHLVFRNVLLAIPDIGEAGAHFTAIVLSIFVPTVVFLWGFGP